MRPPVPVPTLSRRAKLVLGAVAVLLVLFTAIGTLTNVYVDYLWFDETDYTEVFWTELQTRALLLAVGFAIVLLALIGSVLTHYVFGGLRLQTPGQKLTSPARVQLSVLLGLFVALKAIAYWLDRYGLVYSDRGEVFTGASYTDVNALLPAKTILVFAAVVFAIAFFANIVVRNFRLPAAALVLLLLSSLVIGVAYPAIVQQFVVRPSADQRESAYIERAIASTREAYGLGDVEYIDYA